MRSWAKRLLVVPPVALVLSVAAPLAAGTDTPADRFPLSVSMSGRHLEDATGRPFLVHGDASWSLIAELTRDEADLYLTDRAERGVNAILVSLIENKFSSDPPANAHGDPPFHEGTDFARLNERYFAHADWVLNRARELGILVLLAPSYIGGNRGEHGWYWQMKDVGPNVLRAYGRAIGRRYRALDNIIWVHGGDWDPPDPELVSAIAEGIREVDPRALHTGHGAPETVVSETWARRPWLGLDTVYTYGPVPEAVTRHYLRQAGRPFILIESHYEAEGQPLQSVRSQAWQALLGGAAGQVFGNNPIWHFTGPGYSPPPTDWKTALASAGARQMAHLHKLFTMLPWWRLMPDLDGGLLVGGVGSGHGRASAAIEAAGDVAVVHLPSSRTVTLRLDRLRGPVLRVRWYDPTDGHFTPAGTNVKAKGTMRATPPGPNAAGADDWVLVVETREDTP